MCDSKECVSARMALQGVQMRIFALCEQMKFVRQRMNDAYSSAISFWILSMMFLAAAMIAAVIGFIFPGFPQGVALVMGAIAALFFTLALIYQLAAMAYERQLRKLAEEMQKLLADLASAVNVVMENCPPECWESIDFTAPAC